MKQSFLILSVMILALCGCGTTTGPIGLSTSSNHYDFGVNLAGTSVTQTAAVLKNVGSIEILLSPAVVGDASFSLVSNGGCGTTLAPGATCNVLVQYAPAVGSSPKQETATVYLDAGNLAYGDGVTVTGTPGVPSVSLSSSSYDFGDELVGSTATQTAATLTNTGNVPVPVGPTLSGNADFSVASNGGCETELAVDATCEVLVQYAPTVSSTPAQQTAAVNLGLQGLLAATPQTVVVTGTSGALTGTVTPTANSMVALYTLTMPFAGTWNVSFGKNTGYGLTTSMVTVAKGGTATKVYVAGMLPNTTYHMRAMATLADGSVGTDVDHTFGAGALPSGIPATFPVALGIDTPQPGIELIDPIMGSIPSSLIATDLQGNTIWTYKPPSVVGTPYVYPAKLLTNGDVLMYIAPNSLPFGSSSTDVMREINLAGDIVRELSMATLNTELQTAGFAKVNGYFSHDFVVLPNGHVLVIVNTSKPYTDLTGYPGVTNVVGDEVIDLDQNWNPVWVWSEFDHLDVNRHPWPSMFPDWTHSNSIDYSKDDGDFIISMRHQNWVVKVDYDNGAGTGNIIWKLGEGGDFMLQGGVDPTDWFYAQHEVTYASTDTNTTGVYSLTVMDNGDDRIFPTGVTCGKTGEPSCLYTTIQELQLDESTMTATFQFHQILPTSLYNVYGGNVEVLSNGDIEYGLVGASGGSKIFEVTPGSNPQTVWQTSSPNSSGYRGFRMPSLYPGVQW